MARNANGEGSIYKRTRDGRPAGYAAAFTYTDTDGRARRVRVYGPTRAAARDKLKKARERIESGAPARDTSMPIGAWLMHWRATTLAASDRKQATKALYGNLARLHLEPEPFGAIRLDKLRPSDIEKLVLTMRARTKPGPVGTDGERGAPVRALSDSTIRSTYAVLRAALDGAVRDGLLAKNPAALVKRPGVERAEAKHLNQTAVAQVLAAAEDSRYHPALVRIAATGLRRGEVLALAWNRVDLDAGTLKVLATIGRIDGQLVISAPKTERSRRTVPLSAAVVELLRKHRATQAAERLRAGNQWQDSGLVFTTELGGPVDPRNLLRVVEVAAKAAGVETDLHTIRHSAAVAWLEAGVHIKAVADLLGHSSVAITGDIYGHTTDDTARAAVDTLSKALGI